MTKKELEKRVKKLEKELVKLRKCYLDEHRQESIDTHTFEKPYGSWRGIG
jgi:hypothetical protein